MLLVGIEEVVIWSACNLVFRFRQQYLLGAEGDLLVNELGEKNRSVIRGVWLSVGL